MKKVEQFLFIATGILGTFVAADISPTLAATIEFFPIENNSFDNPSLTTTDIIPGGGEMTTIANPSAQFDDLIISGILSDYGISWSGFRDDTKVIANGLTGMGSSGSLSPISPSSGTVKIWGLPFDDSAIDIVNNLPETLTSEFVVTTPENNSILSLLILGISGIVITTNSKIKNNR